MPDYTQFKGVSELGYSLVSDQLESNFVSFFDWSFLQVGGFFNVTFPAAGTRLRPVTDPGYVDGQVWESYRQGWVWESGIPSTTVTPIHVSGVWVNGGFVPYGSGYHINYPLGRVVFDNPVPPSSTVAAEHSFRRVKMATSDAQWFQALQFNTLDFDTNQQAQFSQAASGVWDVLSQNRVQLPAIVIESVARVKITGLEIGSSSRIHEQEMLFHVLAETPFDKKQLHDLVIAQWNHHLVLYDKNSVEDAEDWPLDDRGTPVNSPKTYPQLLDTHRWKVCTILQMKSEPQASYPPLYRATCRASVELDLP